VGEVLLAILMAPGTMIVLLGLELLERRLLESGRSRHSNPPRVTAARTDGGREPGALADRYRLGDSIGLGGAATVYRAWDQHTGRSVPVKLYRHAGRGDRVPIVGGQRPKRRRGDAGATPHPLNAISGEPRRMPTAPMHDRREPSAR